MTKKVKFHGRVIRHPGAEAFTDLSGMVQPGVEDTAIAGLVGTAPKGDLLTVAEEKWRRESIRAVSEEETAKFAEAVRGWETGARELLEIVTG